jgi:hypothetical protein
MTESFEAFTRRVPAFDSLSPADKLSHVAWYLHDRVGLSHVSTSDINRCFDAVHAVPPHTSVYLKRLSEKKPPTFLRSKAGYRLEGKTRKELSDRYSGSATAVAVSSLLRNLVEKLTTDEEREFLLETLKCYSVGAFRAAIVMAWNLAYSHLERWLIANPERLSRFNTSYGVKYLKRSERVTSLESFADFKEHDVIETAAHAKLLSKNVAELLKDKLKRRNAAAHPSLIIITQAQADDVVTDLVNNVVAKLG